MVQPPVAAALIVIEVAGGVEQHDPPATGVGVDPQRHLLGHRAAREERRGRLAERRRDLRLELGDRAAVAVPVRGDVLGELGEEIGRAAVAVPG